MGGRFVKFRKIRNIKDLMIISKWTPEQPANNLLLRGYQLSAGVSKIIFFLFFSYLNFIQFYSNSGFNSPLLRYIILL